MKREFEQSDEKILMVPGEGGCHTRVVEFRVLKKTEELLKNFALEIRIYNDENPETKFALYIQNSNDLNQQVQFAIAAQNVIEAQEVDYHFYFDYSIRGEFESCTQTDQNEREQDTPLT